MSTDDDDFNVRVGRIGNRGRGESFVNQVLRAARKAGHEGAYAAGRRSPRLGNSTFGRGRAAFGRGRLFAGQRRVILKARVARHRNRAFRAAPLTAHIAYLERDGVTRDGEKAHMFSAAEDRADTFAFARRSHDDRHHFRFVVAPEDAAEMTNLKASPAIWSLPAAASHSDCRYLSHPDCTFALVPWTPALDRHLGRHVSGVAKGGGGIEWSFGRRRELEI